MWVLRATLEYFYFCFHYSDWELCKELYLGLQSLTNSRYQLNLAKLGKTGLFSWLNTLNWAQKIDFKTTIILLYFTNWCYLYKGYFPAGVLNFAARKKKLRGNFCSSGVFVDAWREQKLWASSLAAPNADDDEPLIHSRCYSTVERVSSPVAPLKKGGMDARAHNAEK